MSIELLWIIPIVAIALLILMLVLTNQQSNVKKLEQEEREKLKREVDAYNRGGGVASNPVMPTAETRLKEIEGTIQLVSTALSSQQKIIENFQGKDSKVAGELNDLRDKLGELQKEYDIILSENYSLRARLNKIEKNKISDGNTNPTEREDISENDTRHLNRDKLLNMKIFDQKRSFNSSKPSDLDDTSEIELPKIK